MAIALGLFALVLVLLVVHLLDVLKERDAMIESLVEDDVDFANVRMALQSVMVTRQEQFNGFKSRLFDELTKRDEYVNGILESMAEDDVMAANARAALQRVVQHNEEYLRKLVNSHNGLFELANLSLCCQARSGHKFECVGVEMGDEEPVYTFVCKDCSLRYGVLDSNLSKKEEALAKKYVNATYMPKKKRSTKKGK